MLRQISCGGFSALLLPHATALHLEVVAVGAVVVSLWGRLENGVSFIIIRNICCCLSAFSFLRVMQPPLEMSAVVFPGLM